MAKPSITSVSEILNRLGASGVIRVRYWAKNLHLFLKKPRPRHLEHRNNISGLLKETDRSETTHVIMCTWKRVGRLSETLRDLESQTGCKPYLHVWNNNWEDRETVDRILTTAKIPVDVVHSEVNTGGVGRFFLARKLIERHVTEGCFPVVFIDDDQILGKNALETLAGEYSATSLTSIWAFKFMDRRNYWNRRRVEAGEPADYLGTGGMVCPASLFLDSALFKWPARFWFIEDLWLSFYASQERGMTLLGSNAEIDFVEDGLDQYVGMQFRKGKFLEYLQAVRGWSL